MSDFIERIIFDDTNAIEPLQNVKKNLSEVTNEHQKMSKQIQNGTQNIVQGQKELDKAIKTSTASEKAHASAIIDVAKSLFSSTETASKFLNIINKLDGAKIKGMAVSVEDLEKEFIELFETAKLTDNQIKILTNNIDEVANAVGNLTVEEIKEIANSAEKMTQEFKTAKQELRALTNDITSGKLTGEELVKAKIRAAQLKDEISDVQGEIKMLSSDTRKLDLAVESIQGFAAGFQIVEGAMALAGDESEEFQKSMIKLNAIMVLANGLQEAGELLTKKGGIASKVAAGAKNLYAIAVGNSTGALKLFRLALVATGVGAFVVVVGTLIANFDKVKEKTLQWIPALKNIGNVFEGLKAGLSSFFSDFGQIFSLLGEGEFKEAYDKFKQIGKNARAAFDGGVAASETQEKNNAMAAELDKLAKSQRKKAELLDAGGKDNYKIMKNAITNELSALKLRNATAEEIDEKQFELEKLQLERKKKNADAQAAIDKKLEEQLIKYKEQYKSAVKEIEDLSIELGILSEKEQFDIVKQRTLDQLIKLKEELVTSGKALGQDFTKSIENVDKAIEKVANRQYLIEPVAKIPTLFEKAMKEAQDKVLKNPVNIPPPEFASPSKLNVEIDTNDFKNALQGIDNFQDLVQTGFQELGLSEEEAAELYAGIGSFVGEMSKIANEATQIQLKAIDSQIDSVVKRREKLQQELQREIELQNEGLANNVAGKQAEVDAVLAEEKRLNAEKEKLQKEAQKRQLILDTAQQTQSLITSSINIIKGFSNIPVVGLGLGIAAVAALTAFFIKTKAEAFKATRLYTGARQINDHFGFTDKYGETDLPGRGSGYRLINAKTGRDTNVVISGKEMLIPEIISLQNEAFLNKFRLGLYNGIDLNTAIDFYKNFKMKPSQVQVNPKIIHVSDNNQQQAIRQFIPVGKNKWHLVTIKPEMQDGTIIEVA